MAAALASSLALTPSIFRGGSETSKHKFLSFCSKPTNLASTVLPHCHRRHHKTLRILASVSVSSAQVQTDPEELSASILSKVTHSDRGVLLKKEEQEEVAEVAEKLQNYCVSEPVKCPLIFGDSGVLLKKEEHEEVAEVAEKLQNYCVSEPVKCPLIFGDWDVVYCSVPTSPGGGYRSTLGRLVFKTKEMIQVIEAPDVVKNKVSFSAFGFLDGEVSLTGKLTALDDEWIQVIFESPGLKVGPLEFRYGGESEVKLQITYIDDKLRLGKGSRGSLFVGKGSRGSLFVFQRRGDTA